MFSIILSSISLIVSIWAYYCKQDEINQERHREQVDEKESES